MSDTLPHGLEHQVHQQIGLALHRRIMLPADVHRDDLGAWALDTALEYLERHEWGLVAWPDGDDVQMVYPGGTVASAEILFTPGHYPDLPIYLTSWEGLTFDDHARVLVLPAWAGRARHLWWRATGQTASVERRWPRLPDGTYLVAAWASAASTVVGRCWPAAGRRLARWATDVEDRAEGGA